jgi:hypothetical protein
LSVATEPARDHEAFLEHKWVATGCLSLLVLADEAMAAQAAAKLPDYAERVRSAAQQARDSAPVKKAQRLEGELDRARAELNAARTLATHSLQAARKAWEAGEDADAHEQALREAKAQAEVLSQRITALTPLAAAARLQADAVVRAAGQAAWRDVIAEVTKRYQEVLASGRDLLVPWVSELHALHEVSKSFFDQRTGGLPARLLEGSRG